MKITRHTRLAAAAALGLGLAAVAYLTLWPVRVDPVAWTPPPAPEAAGPYASNAGLAGVTRLAPEVVHAPEDIAVGPDGFVYADSLDGKIYRVSPDGAIATVYADTGGRPLGLKFDGAGRLFVADAIKGLLAVEPDGRVTALSAAAGGVPYGFCDDLDVAADGTVFFTDASSKFGVAEYELDFLEHGPNGRLLALDPGASEARVVRDGLHFANGVAVSPDGAFVLVVESSEYRVLRCWLSGERRGAADVFVDDLPGIPDGILSNGRGGYWIAIATPRSRLLDALLPHPFARKVAARLPLSWFPRPPARGYAVEVDAEGRVVRTLQDASAGAYAPVTNVVEHDGTLFLGSLSANGVGRLELGR